MKIRDPNVRAALAASLLCAGLILAIALLSVNPAGDPVDRRASTFFTDQTGTRAIYLVLDELLPSVEQWRRPLTELAVADGSTLIAMGPSSLLSPSEARALDTWIASGGQLILATSDGWSVGNASEPEDEEPDDYLARHGFDPIELPETGDAVARSEVKAVGLGRIVYVPDGYAFSNDDLRGSDNAVWLVEQSASWGAVVLFDEYHHRFGQKRGLGLLIGMFLVSPWGLACLQVVLAGGVYMLGTKRRFGKPVEDLTEERTNPTEPVEALGSLLKAARARSPSARAIQQYLNLRLSGLLGYRVDVCSPESRDRLAGRAHLGRVQLDAFAQAVDELTNGGHASDQELIRLAEEATSIAGSFSHGNDRGQYRALAG